MLALESDVFFRSPDCGDQRVLIPAVVVEQEEDVYVARFNRESVPFESDSGVLVYYIPRNEFLQQACRVQEVGLRVVEGEETESLCATFVLTGEPVSAESRQCYRVSTVFDELVCTVNGEPSVTLGDVSMTGLAIITEKQYRSGEELTVSIEHDGKSFEGQAVVNNAKELPGGLTRYGLYCTDGAGAKAFKHGLHVMTMSLQREKLRRQSGAGAGV